MCFKGNILFISELKILLIGARDLKDKKGEEQGPVLISIYLSLSQNMKVIKSE